jgi:2Fe-2S ferredoxin
MATIRFKGYGEVTAREGATILEAAQELGAPEGAECGGCCSCSTCHVYVLQGAELLSKKDDDELDILENADDIRDNSRLGCQASVLGDGVIEVEISKESFETFLIENPSQRARFGKA